ncbi:class I SAM-dependent methyltransferase [Martelella mediterranea]|uniref:16S rRNA m(2)G 1207 methyltransferase n=1 Tax=Martelella mediterranea TaxID=293089 RepID=A0A4R3P2D8_9HYPH|nr:class I SAM-dependent methyltransferase [Martelella mediterranea]TCT41093.1 16S rRNA m(2)G 1207 methyltransferase [Martelella mediterranea]
MSRDTLKTLFHPFESEVIAMPESGRKCLFLGAEPGYRLPDGFEAEVDAVQPLRPHYNALEKAGSAVTPEAGEGPYDLALILLTKHRGENENRIVEALQKTVPGALIMIAGSKEEGAQSLRKRLKGLFDDLESMPKYHGLAVWFHRPDDIAPAVEALAHPTVEIDGRFTTVPGLFSHDRIDEGSRILGEHLPEDFSGLAADFGAGWGYLSAMLAERSPRTVGIDLYEADFRALERAKVNLAVTEENTAIRYFWQDLVNEKVKTRYDLVILNPPFHAGKATEPSLGKAIVEAACNTLKLGGKLFLVANRGLPYEDVLAANCKKSGEDYRNARFKVLWAVK